MADDRPASQRPQAVKPTSPSGSVSSDSTVGRGADPQAISNNQSSTPSYDSPRRHHARNRNPRQHRVKETLNARSEYTNSVDDGAAEHRINQYLIRQEIGRGSFGAVHLGVDQYGKEYAVKEFSKSRLRKRAQSQVLRQNHSSRRPAGVGFNSPLHMHPSGNEEPEKNPLYLIQEEIAIMKKLHHSNLVALVEVLDDPTEDSLYMVMEMCKKGVVMKIGLGEETDPYEDERCRCWFRDMILGIEYLHAQGIVHRDIKPDNCLVTGDDVLKIVDFGVSEMFEKDSAMFTAKSAGSPAFLPPELCVAKHGDVSGKAADIWSMGVTLFCLRYGRIPFAKESIFELYEAIRESKFDLEGETDEDFRDLMVKILEKDPDKRITMPMLRAHPWVTKGGTDPLLSAEENTASIVGPPTEEEMNAAITKNLSHVFAVMKAVRNFKKLIQSSSTPPTPIESILGNEAESHFVQPPLAMEEPNESEFGAAKRAPRPTPRRPRPSPYVLDTNLDSSGPSDSSTPVKRNVPSAFPESGSQTEPAQQKKRAVESPRVSTPGTQTPIEGKRGHARDPLEEGTTFLCIGPSTFSGYFDDERVGGQPHNEASAPGHGEPDPGGVDDDLSAMVNETMVISESPGAADMDIYETAYQEEINRISSNSLQSHSPAPKLYLTRRIEGKKSALSSLIRQAVGESPLSAASPDTSTPKIPALARVAGRLGNSASDSGSASPTTETQPTQTSPPEAGGAASSTNSTASSSSQNAPPSLAAVRSTSSTAVPTTTTTNITASMSASSSPTDGSRSGLRSLLDKARHGK